MRSKHPEPASAPTCPLCKQHYVKEETPSGICSKCQAKIGAVILVIMVTMSGVVFFGLL